MFKNTERTKKSNAETCLHNAKEVAACDTKIQATTLVLPGARIREHVVERTWRKISHCRFASGWHVQVSYFPPDISSNRATVAWTVEERRKRLPFPKCIRQQEDSPEDHIEKQFTMHLQPMMPMVWDLNWKSGTDTEKSGRNRAKST